MFYYYAVDDFYESQFALVFTFKHVSPVQRNCLVLCIKFIDTGR